MDSILSNYAPEEKDGTSHNEEHTRKQTEGSSSDHGDKEVENRGKTDKDNQKEHKEGTRSSGDDDRSKDERRDRRDDRRDNRRDDRREDRRDDRRDERRRDDRRDDTRRDDRRDRRDDRKDYKRDREERETGFSKGGNEREYSSVPPPTYHAAPKANSTAPLTVAQKKKLLWGNKKAESAKEEVPTYNPSPSAPSDSASVWADSKFTDDKRKDKFLQLMGAKKRKTEEEYDPLKPTSPPRTSPPPTASTGDADQDKLYDELEKQYNTSTTRRLTGTTMGLGF